MLNPLTRLLVRPYVRKRRPARKVAIVVPLSSRPELTPDEKISLRHLLHYLGRYDIYLIAPEGMQIEVEGCQVKHFPKRFFGSAAAHGRLLYSPFFYKTFIDYEYMFFYHLDALVLSDQLEQWCDSGLDYIGAPWIRCSDTPWVRDERVGNGGFALLKVESALKVFHNRYRQRPQYYWLEMFSRNNGRRFLPLTDVLSRLKRLFPDARWITIPLDFWNATEHFEKHGLQNDRFWADEAVSYLEEFKVASLEQGLEFAFEAAPRLCFERTNRRMPFGCHAFARYDRSFWEPYLLKELAENDSEQGAEVPYATSGVASGSSGSDS